MFMQACVTAGPHVCPLYEPSVEKVHARITNILNNLKRRPLSVRPNSTSSEPGAYGLVDYRIAKMAIFTFLYSPYGGGKPAYPALRLAYALSEAGKGNGAPLLKYDAPFWPLKCECAVPGEPKNLTSLSPDPLVAIMGSDAAVQNDTVEDLEAHFDAMFETSEFADMWPFRARCK